MCIRDRLETIDAANADIYAANAKAYLAQLDSLDEQYQSVVDRAQFHTVLFGDRFPFRYLVDDYDLDYYAAFVGCSAETEASFETIAFLDVYKRQSIVCIFRLFLIRPSSKPFKAEDRTKYAGPFKKSGCIWTFRTSRNIIKYTVFV